MCDDGGDYDDDSGSLADDYDDMGEHEAADHVRDDDD